MTDTSTGTKRSAPPSISEVAFDCPYCGAYTTQTWFDLYISNRPKDSRTPGRPDPDAVQSVQSDKEMPPEVKRSLIEFFKAWSSGHVFLDKDSDSKYLQWQARNLNISSCYACEEIAVWVADRLVHPPTGTAPAANDDLPADVRADYDEASRILSLSPRGAAALLRLAIQKLCRELGEKGKNVDDDIAALVKKGLNPMVQRALDTVRVIGNEAVHPGQVDLRDDTDTAAKLFKLVNIIAEQMISNPKHVDALFYEKVPESKREAIAKRDGKT